jgi:hypothetical protein
MNQLILSLFIWAQIVSQKGVAAEANNNDVYTEAIRIEKEILNLKHHFKVKIKVKPELKSGNLQPRHVWAMTYVILLKLGKLRRLHHIPYIEPVNIEPMIYMSPTLAWAMTQKILTEINIVKFYLNLHTQTPPKTSVNGKSYLDSYNKLNTISAELDLLTSPVTESEVYVEAKRLNEDVDKLLQLLHIFDSAVPPTRKENFKSQDSLNAIFLLLKEIQRIQTNYGLDTTDLSGFEMGNNNIANDVYSLVLLALLELQQVKAQLGMVYQITPGSTFDSSKTPSDVVQLMGYISTKLKMIKSKEL